MTVGEGEKGVDLPAWCAVAPHVATHVQLGALPMLVYPGTINIWPLCTLVNARLQAR